MSERNCIFRLFFLLLFELLLPESNYAFSSSNHINRHLSNGRPEKTYLFMSYLDSLSKKCSDDDFEKQNKYIPLKSDVLKSSQDEDVKQLEQPINSPQPNLSKPSYRVFASFRIGDKVKIISGGYSGNVGYVVSVYPDMVKVELSQTRTFLFEIQQLLNLDRQTSQPYHIRENFDALQRPDSADVSTKERLEQNLPLSNDQINQILKDMKFWKVPSFHVDKSKVETIYRSFSCKNVQSALEAINSIGLISEREGQFPDLHISSFREVEVVVNNEKVGGITMEDIKFAKMIDEELESILIF